MVEVMTDKATVELPSPVAGVVLSVGAAVGEILSVGSPLIRIDTGGAGSTNGETAAKAVEDPPPAVAEPDVALAPEPRPRLPRLRPPSRWHRLHPRPSPYRPTVACSGRQWRPRQCANVPANSASTSAPSPAAVRRGGSSTAISTRISLGRTVRHDPRAALSTTRTTASTRCRSSACAATSPSGWSRQISDPALHVRGRGRCDRGRTPASPTQRRTRRQVVEVDRTAVPDRAPSWSPCASSHR